MCKGSCQRKALTEGLSVCDVARKRQTTPPSRFTPRHLPLHRGGFERFSLSAPSASASARPRSCPVPHFAQVQNGDPFYFTSSAEMNSACGKVLLRKTLVRADARGGLCRQPNWADGFRKLRLSSQLHQLLLQLALDLAQYPILRKRKTGTPFILHPRRK